MKILDFFKRSPRRRKIQYTQVQRRRNGKPGQLRQHGEGRGRHVGWTREQSPIQQRTTKRKQENSQPFIRRVVGPFRIRYRQKRQ